MASATITDDLDDRLFAVLDATQGLQRRAFRIRSRGFFNEHSVDEMRHQVRGLMADIEELARATEEE